MPCKPHHWLWYCVWVNVHTSKKQTNTFRHDMNLLIYHVVCLMYQCSCCTITTDSVMLSVRTWYNFPPEYIVYLLGWVKKSWSDSILSSDEICLDGGLTKQLSWESFPFSYVFIYFTLIRFIYMHIFTIAYSSCKTLFVFQNTTHNNVPNTYC